MTDVHVFDREVAVRRAFTLTELLVAVVVLLVIILAVGRIFGTASKVVKNGEATANILQETTAFEQLIRNDLSRISDEGFLMVQCVAVRNDASGQLLDPTLPADHIFRCDQIAFVADDLTISRQTQSMGQFVENGIDGQGFVDYLGQTLPTPQSTASVLYYGHGLQFPYLPQNLGFAADPLWPSNGGPAIQPWFRPAPGQDRIELQRWPQGSSAPGTYNGTQPPAPEWTLARQETLLADDYDAAADHYMSRRTAAGIYRNAASNFFDDAMRSGRVDVLSNDVGRLRDAIRNFGPQGLANVLLNYRPRAEKRPPTLDKSDVLLTTNVLAMNCSNFVVDWTWSDGVGRELELDLDPDRNLKGAIRGVSHRGGVRPAVGGESGSVITEAAGRMPWFGLGAMWGNPDNQVLAASELVGLDFYNAPVRLHAPIAYHPGNQIFRGGPIASTPFGPGSNTVPQVLAFIEQQSASGNYVDQPFPGVWRYRAFFGLNGKEPFVRDGENRPMTTAAFEGGGPPWPIYRSDYTPWPSALRITATFHDPQGAIEGGRTLQFTIPLPQRVQDLPEG
jgi:prepilin-type N-terminal cleavage/methylation domain-containing protein